MPVTVDSDPTIIAQMQARLVEWNWLESEVYVPGQLDEATIQAVLDFQNAVGADSLQPVDPMDPIIGTDTLALLMNDYGQTYYR